MNERQFEKEENMLLWIRERGRKRECEREFQYDSSSANPGKCLQQREREVCCYPDDV